MYLTSYKSGVKTRIENLVSCVPVQPPLIYFFGNNLYIHPHRKERNKLENSVRPRVRLGFDAKVSFKSSKSGQISFLCSSLETSAKVDFPSRLWSHIPPTLYLYDNRELKQTTTATATRTSPNKRLNEQNNSSARAFEVLVHFLAVLCKTTT